LVSVPANFAILGGFILSNMPSSETVLYPDYVAWSVASLADALWVSMVALALMLPVIWLGFVVLYRRMGRELAGLFLVSNVLLLVPLRDSLLVGGSVLLLALIILVLSQRISRHCLVAKTEEGRLALALQFLPLAVMAGRSVWLYSANEFVFFTLAAVMVVAVRQVAVSLQTSRKVRISLELLSLILTIVAGVATGALIESLHFSEELSVIAAMFVMSGLMYELSMRAVWAAAFYRGLALFMLVAGASLNTFVFNTLETALLSVVVGIGASLWAYKTQQLKLLVVGLSLVLLSVLEQVLGLVQFFNFGGWLSLALMGISAIVIASVLESRSALIKPWWVAKKAKFANWA